MTPQPDTDPNDATIQRISSRIVYQNPWMQLREDVIQRPDGSQGIYSYVEKPDFALIIPVERDGFHLVEQYRYPVSHRSWEFPQGTLPNREDGDPTELARRELAEETGLRAGHIHRLGHLYPAKGMSSQGCTVFVAEQLEAGQHSREHEEQDMRQGQFSQAELEDMIRVGVVTDDSTIAAYMLYLLANPARTAEGPRPTRPAQMSLQSVSGLPQPVMRFQEPAQHLIQQVVGQSTGR